jgi:formate C-acetyltransferase
MKITSDELIKYKNKFGGDYKFGLSSPSYVNGSIYSEASLDGRKKNTPYNVHISSTGQTAYTELINFASNLDYSINKYNANVVDFIVSPNIIDNNYEKFVDFLMISLQSNFFEIQMNVVSSKTLIEAKNNPELFPNLIVRVWGFSAYFNDLPLEYKDVLISRALDCEGINHEEHSY